MRRIAWFWWVRQAVGIASILAVDSQVPQRWPWFLLGVPAYILGMAAASGMRDSYEKEKAREEARRNARS